MAESLEKPQIIIHLEKQLNYTVYDTKWIPCSAKFVALGSHPRNTGALQVYELSKGELKLVSEVSGCWEWVTRDGAASHSHTWISCPTNVLCVQVLLRRWGEVWRCFLLSGRN